MGNSSKNQLPLLCAPDDMKQIHNCSVKPTFSRWLLNGNRVVKLEEGKIMYGWVRNLLFHTNAHTNPVIISLELAYPSSPRGSVLYLHCSAS